jgi:L-amino acid N-acyltransferase YncA
MIRPATSEDSRAICNIYNHYVLHTVVTFEEISVLVSEMQQRVAEIQNKYSWLVWEEAGMVIGYAYAGPWKTRAAYRHAVEISVYLDPAHTGRGIGRKLYGALINDMRLLKMHAVIGGVALPNDASIKLHESLGFKKIAQFAEVGRKFEKWVDVAYWELILGN